jgi:hypothetical protein
MLKIVFVSSIYSVKAPILKLWLITFVERGSLQKQQEKWPRQKLQGLETAEICAKTQFH